MTSDEEISLISRLPLLSELDTEAIRVLAFSTDTRHLKAGDILVRRGEPSEGGYIVLSGSLSIIGNMSEDTEVAVIHAGSMIGEMALITQTVNQATIIAREGTTILWIPRNLFQRILREYPGGAARLRMMIEKRLSEFTKDLQSLRSNSLED